MGKLHRWATQQPRPMKFFAAWSWLTELDTIVDVIDPGEALEWVDDEVVAAYVADVEADLFGDETLPTQNLGSRLLRGLWTEISPLESSGGLRQWLYVGVLDSAFEEMVGSQRLDDLVLQGAREEEHLLAAEATGRMLSVWLSADQEPEPNSLPQSVLSQLEQ